MALNDAESAFVREYFDLCERHRLVITHDDGYMSTEVSTFIDAHRENWAFMHGSGEGDKW